MNLKGVDCSSCSRAHDDRYFELGMSGKIVRMVVSEEHEFEGGFSVVDELVVGGDIEDGVDEKALLFGLDVVGEDGEF